MNAIQMKYFEALLAILMYVVILPSRQRNDAEAVANNGVSHVAQEDLKENLKISRTKRTLDNCERLISGYKDNKYPTCIPLGDRNPFCNEEKCLDKPSEPDTMNHTFTYNKETKRLSLNIRWSKPQFGISSLCGFQINIIMLYPSLDTDCFQLNSKDVFSYTIQNVLFNAEYKIRIVSLPGYKKQDKSSASIKIKTPDRCKTMKLWNEILTWDCKVTDNFPVACENGGINVTLERPNNVDMDYYYSMVMIYNSQPVLPVNQSFHSKGLRFVIYDGLKLNMKYVLKVLYIKGEIRVSVSSQPFTCRAQQSTTSRLSSSPAPSRKDRDRNQDGKTLLFISLSVILIILVAIIVCIKCKFMDAVMNMFKIQPRPDVSEKLAETLMHQLTNTRALIVYPFGCEHLNDLVLLLGQLFQDMNCQCILDLVDKTVQDGGDREIFLMTRLDEAQKSDYIIFVNHKDTNRQSQNALECHYKMILGKLFGGMLAKRTFISIHFNAEDRTEHATNINFAGDIEKELANLVRIFMDTPAYELGESLPQENTIEVPPLLKEAIIYSIHSLLAGSHGNCLKGLCIKGEKGVCKKPMKYPALTENSTPTNSFVSLKLTDNDAIEYQHITFSRRFSSEPLLTAV